MKLRFTDKTLLDIIDHKLVDGHLEIETAVEMTAEELQEKFSTPGNLQDLAVLTDDEVDPQVITEYHGWTRYASTELTKTSKKVALVMESDVTAERLQKAEAGALAAHSEVVTAKAELNAAKLDIETEHERYKEEVSQMVDQKVNTVKEAADVVVVTKKVAQITAQTFDDKQAVAVKDIYDTWSEVIGQTVSKGFKFTYEGTLYKVIQDNLKIQEHYVPGQGTESLYTVIDEEHAGTKEDPIPYKLNMEIFNGKYYTEDGILYLCNRNSGQALHNSLSSLVNIYVTVVTQ